MATPLNNLRRLAPALLALWLLVPPTLSPSSHAAAPPKRTQARVIKVLQHLVDQQGRHSLSPSLFERDAYQAFLRTNPGEVSGLRFDVHWRLLNIDRSQVKLRLELRTSANKDGKPTVLESPISQRTLRGNWTSLQLDGSAYKQAGKIIAWRASLWKDGQQLAEEASFLW